MIKEKTLFTNEMKVIGITGGVGSGKTQITEYLKEKCSCFVLLADEVAHLLQEPGGPCYNELIHLFGNDILQDNNTINRSELANRLFMQEKMLDKVNKIIHPLVKQFVIGEINRCKKEGMFEYFFIEAALLIEDHYEELVDEMWYIFAEEDIRRNRLKSVRGYSDEKIDSIIKNQLSDEEFRKHCNILIDNSGSLQETYRKIDNLLEG